MSLRPLISPGFCVVLALCAAFAFRAAAHAQAPISASDYEIDVVATPVVGSSRIIGLGGAHVALAEGSDGVTFNPAAYASRTPWEFDWYEYDIVASMTLPFATSQVDYFNNGRGDGYGVDEYRFFDLGGRVQFGGLGTGVLLNSESYRIGRFATRLTQVRTGAGYSLLDGGLVIGLGTRILHFSIFDEVDRVSLVNASDVGIEGGFIWRPRDQPFRLGMMARSGARSEVTAPGQTERVGEFILPRAVHAPWELRFGMALQLGPRPFNTPFIPIKHATPGLRAELRMRQCERERRQVLRERSLEGEEASRLDLRCPNLSARARDPQWLLAEADRRAEEEAALEEDAAVAEDTLSELWWQLYRSLPRRYLLLTFDVLLQGPSESGIGVDAFLRQEQVPRGEHISYGLYFGMEGEPWSNRMKLRAGAYLDPSRTNEVGARMHGTFGFELRLLRFFGEDWRIGFTFDGARDFISWGFSFGAWR